MNSSFTLATLALLTAIGTSTPALAADHQHMHHHAASVPEASSALSDGTVKKLDKAKKQITIAHGPLKNLNMGPMTMSFGVSDPALLAKVKEGDKVRFLAEDRKGELFITKLEVAR